MQCKAPSPKENSPEKMNKIQQNWNRSSGPLLKFTFKNADRKFDNQKMALANSQIFSKRRNKVFLWRRSKENSLEIRSMAVGESQREKENPFPNDNFSVALKPKPFAERPKNGRALISASKAVPKAFPVGFGARKRRILEGDQKLGFLKSFENAPLYLPAAPGEGPSNGLRPPPNALLALRRRRLSANSSFTHKYLHKLRCFAARLFGFARISREDLHALSPAERQILAHFLAANKFAPKGTALDGLFLRSRNLSLWSRLRRPKSRNQNLKLGLGILVAFLRASFARENACRLPPHAGASPDLEMLFYAHYFGHLEFSMNFFQLVHAVEAKLATRARVWGRLAKYVLPDAAAVQPGVDAGRAVGAELLADWGRSRRFLEAGVSALLEGIAALASLEAHASGEPHFFGAQSWRLPQKAALWVELIQKRNKEKTVKVFKAWEARVIAKGTFVDVGCSQSIRDSLEVVKAAAKKPRTDLPWTLLEVRYALVDSLLELLEHSPESAKAEGKRP